MVRAGLLVLILAFLAGCSPDYNWREVGVADGMVRAAFPDKPDTVQRVLEFSGQDVSFTLTAATVKGAVFAVGYAPLPPALKGDGKGTQMGRTVIASFYQGLGLEVPAVLPEFGAPFDLTGHDARKRAVRLRARVWVLPHALVEGMVTADAADFPEPQAEEFLRGLAVGAP